MMNINIDISDYLSEEEIKDECRAAIRSCIVNKFEKESELNRLISNLGYEFIFKAINETTGEDSLQKIKNAVVELINKKHSIGFELYRKKDAWDNEEGIGRKILNAAIKENEPLIREKVREVINDYDYLEKKDIQERMEDVFHEMLEEKMFRTKEE